MQSMQFKVINQFTGQGCSWDGGRTSQIENVGFRSVFVAIFTLTKVG